MNRWLVSTACMLTLATPMASAQVSRDPIIRTTDTTITQTQTTTRTDTMQRADTLKLTPSYRAGRNTSPDTVYRTPSPYATTTTTTRTGTDNDHSQAGFEIKGGLSWGNVSNRGVLPGALNGRNGVAVGLGVFGGSPVGFGIEGLYVQRGVDNAAFDAFSRRLDYIDVPAYLRLSVPFTLQPFVYAGPQASFEIRCRSGVGDCPDTGRPVTSWSGIIGAGIRFNPGVAMTVEGRYVYGLTDLKLTTITSSSSYRTRSFMLLLGLGI
jgi:hypothetical protein